MRKYFLTLFALLLLILSACGDSESGTTLGDSGKQEAESEEREEEDSIFKEHEDLLFADFTMRDITTEVKENELIFKFTWLNQSDWDDSPFTVLGYIDVSQGGEYIEEQSDNPQTHDRNAKGGALPVTLKYDLLNDEDIEILIGATNEDAPQKETITVEIN